MPKKKLLRKDFKWNSNLAYAVGLITTDGYLSTDKRHVSLTSSDKQLLETFKLCLNKKNIITVNPASLITKKQAYRIQIGDVVLYDWLIKIGLFPRKSLTLKSIKMDKKYFADFVRGHLDGDGSIIFYKDKYNTYINPSYIYERLFVYFISASKQHILWLRKNIFAIKDIKGSISKIRSKTQKSKSTIFRLKFSTREAKILLNWIYYKQNLPCLLRKHKIASQFLKTQNVDCSCTIKN